MSIFGRKWFNNPSLDLDSGTQKYTVSLKRTLTPICSTPVPSASAHASHAHAAQPMQEIKEEITAEIELGTKAEILEVHMEWVKNSGPLLTKEQLSRVNALLKETEKTYDFHGSEVQVKFWVSDKRIWVVLRTDGRFKDQLKTSARIISNLVKSWNHGSLSVRSKMLS